MKLDYVQIKHFRNIDALSIQPDPTLNVFTGANGSGKSSILEALHYLGFARSFRTAKHKTVIQQQQAEFTVFGRLVSEQGVQKKLGISRHIDDNVVVSVDGVKSKSTVELVSQLPVQIFTPQSSELILGSPGLRRRYIDWLLFHVEHSFSAQVAMFKRCVLQLNASYKLRTGHQQQAALWWQQIALFGEQLSLRRQQLLAEGLLDSIYLVLKQFLPEFCFEILYYKGWEKELSLYEALEKNYDRDRRNGFVANGPHKADLRIKANGVSANEILSRGQIRMLVAALQIAQSQYLFSAANKSIVFLLDDIGAELDVNKQELFINSLLNYDSQLFVTAIDKEQIKYISHFQAKKLFHVEHGQVREEI